MQQKEAPVFFCLQERKDCDRLQETARPTDSIRKQKGESSMPVIYHAAGATFHLYNPYYSYLIKLLPDGTPGQLYFGAPLRDREEFDHLLELRNRPLQVNCSPQWDCFSLDSVKLEYPCAGTTDFRRTALEAALPDGSRTLEPRYLRHEITPGKPKLPGLPATYVEGEEEADTLTLTLLDEPTGLLVHLRYTVFARHAALARSVTLENTGAAPLTLTRAMSLSLDLPDGDYQWMELMGGWGKERTPVVRDLAAGVTSIESVQGCSSAQENPFVILKRKETTEFSGEALGLSLVYSGNFLLQAQVDSWNAARLMGGIHPEGFGWVLYPEKSFTTPEAVLAYTQSGLNDLSQTYHTLYRSRLARGEWRDKPRPVLLNGWEAAYMDFDHRRMLQLAQSAAKLGVELFVLDDGWFGHHRDDDRSGLGDWFANLQKLPGGIARLAGEVHDLGMLFGLWFEPEMVNEDSDLYRAHPDWVIQTPGRQRGVGRNQYVLDFSRQEVVDNLFAQMEQVLAEGKVDYVKWDMNRCITQPYSAALPPHRQGEFYHRYILGVYSLYQRLIAQFPHILFESCASGGNRFDPGMLYYAPQAWCSDNTDAIARLQIQYGTSYCYPLSSMGSHVSICPNHQVFRTTPLSTRFGVAAFGAFGYELDVTALSQDQLEEIKAQIAWFKQHRSLLQFGDFYRLQSPFTGNVAGWMVVSRDKTKAIAGEYKILAQANAPYRRLKLAGLNPDTLYAVNGENPRYGDELMQAGLVTTDHLSGWAGHPEPVQGDFSCKLFLLEAQT